MLGKDEGKVFPCGRTSLRPTPSSGLNRRPQRLLMANPSENGWSYQINYRIYPNLQFHNRVQLFLNNQMGHYPMLQYNVAGLK